MKVLHLIKTPIGATWAVRQIRVLMQLGIKIHVAIPEGLRARDLVAAGAEVHLLQTDIATRNPLEARRRVEQLRQLVDDVEPNVVHSHFVGTTVAMRLALKRVDVPRIFQVPGPLHLENPVFRAGELALADSRDHWVATCRWTRDRYIRSGVDAGRVSLSYYGVDIEHHPPTGTGRLRDLVGLDTDVPMVGMVAYMYPPKRFLGQLSGLKGHEDLIAAAALLAERGRDFRVVFVGGPWNDARDYERRIHRLAAAKLGERAVFLGTRSDVAELYPDLDIAVHPSHSENVGGAVESLLAGVPTVASNVGGLPDLVIHEETGLLVPRRDRQSLAAAIEVLLDNPQRGKEMADAGRALARRLFDVTRNAAEIAGTYEDVTR